MPTLESITPSNVSFNLHIPLPSRVLLFVGGETFFLHLGDLHNHGRRVGVSSPSTWLQVGTKLRYQQQAGLRLKQAILGVYMQFANNPKVCLQETQLGIKPKGRVWYQLALH